MRFCSLRRKNHSPPWRFLRVGLGMFFLVPVALFAAEYQGQNVDGSRYCGFARLLETGKYYSVTVVFDHNRVNVRLESGKGLDLTIDEQSVEDPEEVLATD